MSSVELETHFQACEQECMRLCHNTTAVLAEASVLSLPRSMAIVILIGGSKSCRGQLRFLRRLERTHNRNLVKMMDRVFREIESSRLLRIVMRLKRMFSVGRTVRQTPGRAKVTSTMRSSPIDPVMVRLSGCKYNFAEMKLFFPEIKLCLL